MRNLLVDRWEAQLKQVFDGIDEILETRFGHLYPLHPSRASKEKAANPQDGGLFELSPAFTAGFGSANGPGYFFQIRWATLSSVTPERRREIETLVLELLRERLPMAFPGKNLTVLPEGSGFKIIGDLSLEG